MLTHMGVPLALPALLQSWAAARRAKLRVKVVLRWST